MRHKISKVIEILIARKAEWASSRGLIGFDGFVDKLVRPIRKKNDENHLTYFQDMAEFGEYVVSKQGLSACIELDGIIEKAGGNGPILASALGRLGVQTDCIGAMGSPEIYSVFEPMRSVNCSLHSYAEPGFTTSMEFNSGKLMLAQMNEFSSIKWDTIKACIGLEKIIDLFSESNMIGVVNWSEIFHSNTIWEGILEEILPVVGADRSKFLFLDLSDCSGRKQEHIQYALMIMKQYTRYYRVAFGMNENEAQLIYKALYDKEPDSDMIGMGTSMYASLGIDTLLIHRAQSCLGWTNNGAFSIDNYYTDSPLLLTGVGDNFNAGYCAAKLLGLDIESNMIVANAVAGFYVRKGYSPTSDELIELLQEWHREVAEMQGECI